VKRSIKSTEKRVAKRHLFAELTEGMTGLSDARQGRRTLKTHAVEYDELRKTELDSLEATSDSSQEFWRRGEYTISTERSRLDVELIHDFVSNQSYWGRGRAREVVERSIENSMAFGIYHGEQQVGFARIVTDYATFAWVADVFVMPEYRGRGLAKWLMEVILAHPRLQEFRRWVLSTKDAHGLYEQFGFIKLHRPERWMERPDPNMKESPDYWQP